jgi:hypothetical protein
MHEFLPDGHRLGIQTWDGQSSAGNNAQLCGSALTPTHRPILRADGGARQGQGHPAQLNMGDCAVCALAKSVNEPLLFVGNDYSTPGRVN